MVEEWTHCLLPLIPLALSTALFTSQAVLPLPAWPLSPVSEQELGFAAMFCEGTAEGNSMPPCRRPARLAAAVLATAAVSTLLISRASLRGGAPLALEAHEDPDDRAFFSASRTLAHEGDRDMRRADAAMDHSDVRLALRLSREAARAYSRGLDDQRLDVARKVEQQLVGALAARRAEHRALLGKVLAHAEKLNAAAHAGAGAASTFSTAPSAKSADPASGMGSPEAQIKLLVSRKTGKA